MKVFASLLAIAIVSAAPVSGANNCGITKIDFEKSKLVQNKLHLKKNNKKKDDGTLRYQDIGIYNNQPLDLVITDATSGNKYPNIMDLWGKKGVQNGEAGKFGKINLQVTPNDANAGYGKFDFCFMKKGTFTPQKVPEFIFTFYDIDTPQLTERLSIKKNMYTQYNRGGGSDSNLAVSFTSALATFQAKKGGQSVANPNDPNKMTAAQIKQSVSFRFKNKSCFQIVYDISCIPGSSYCKNGGNFLFSGESDEIDKPCPTSPPTKAPVKPTKAPVKPTKAPVKPTKAPVKPTKAPVKPTKAPVKPTKAPVKPTKAPVKPTKAPVSPTREPTRKPTRNPTREPTLEPTRECEDSTKTIPDQGFGRNKCHKILPKHIQVECEKETVRSYCPSLCNVGRCGSESPSYSPSASPSGSYFPSQEPTDSPSKSPEPSESPSDRPTNAPTDAPTTKAPTSAPTVSPTDSPTNSPTDSPTNSPTDSPTNPPTDSPTNPPSVSPSSPPTNNPTDSPTEPPTDHPTADPTPYPTDPPTDHPTNGKTPRPTSGDRSCPEDVEVIHTNGSTIIESLGEAVEIIAQETETVTVKLRNTWEDRDEGNIDAIFFSYKETAFHEVCYEETEVENYEVYAEEVKLTCNKMNKFAPLKICVANEGPPLGEDDDAEIPKCCHKTGVPENAHVVCYHLIVWCDSQCNTEISRRSLRGFIDNVLL